MNRGNLALAAIVSVAIAVIVASLVIDVIPCDSYWSIGPTCDQILEVLEAQE